MEILTKLEPQGVENSQDLVDGQDDHISALATICEGVIQSIVDRDPHNLAQCLSQFCASLEQAEEIEDAKSKPVQHYE